MKKRTFNKLALLFPLGFALILADNFLVAPHPGWSNAYYSIFVIGMISGTIGGYFARRILYGWFGRQMDITTGGTGKPVGDYPFEKRGD